MSTVDDGFPLPGTCACGHIRYRAERPPLFVHCCHCSCCQRESGSAFVINALIETSAVLCISGEPADVLTPSASGRGQHVFRCPKCQVALWSIYPDAGPAILFLRVGTLERPDLVPPDIHIYTSTRLPWVEIPDQVRSVPEFYEVKDVWPEASLARYRAARAAHAARVTLVPEQPPLSRQPG